MSEKSSTPSGISFSEPRGGSLPRAKSTEGRKIAPLPLRARKSADFRSSQNILSASRSRSRSTLSETDPSLPITSTTPNARSQKAASDEALEYRESKDKGNDVPRIMFQFGQSGDFSSLENTQEMPTFRNLHNITPRPSPEREKIPLPSSQNPSNYSLFSNSSTAEQTISQPLHTLYLDEKIPANPSEPNIRSKIEAHSDVPDARPSTPVSLSQVSELSPASGLQRERSISELSAVSDNMDNQEPYDVRDEEAPLEPFFTPAFQKSLQDGLGIANNVVTALERTAGASRPSGDLKRLLGDARRLGTFHSTDTRTIAVLGDSGEGKSSLINALLHFPEIAKTGDIGAACTSVVTEYRQKTRDHTAPITIEVEYLSEREIEDLIKEQLWNYRQIFLPGVEEDTIDPKDYARFQRESEQAWSALEAGFKHQREFSKTLLFDMTEGGLEKATAKLVQWAHELEWPDGDRSGLWKATADTAEECCDMTSVFMEDRFWPFTKIIRVYLNSQVLKTGVVLADLPGLQDTNLARVRATQTYLMKCDNIFIVAKISRAITDSSLKSSLYSILARHAPVEWEESGGKSLNLAVVCTKSEDINQKTARREFCGPGKRIPLAVMSKLDKDIETSKRTGDKALKKQLKRRQELILIGARNDHVKQGLQSAYSSKVPGGQMDVFCVSNTTYEKYSRKGNTEMVHASGIPELRKFCHKITADAQLREAKHFLQSTLSSLLGSVELWSSAPPPNPQVEVPRPDKTIRDHLKQLQFEVSNAINRSKADFRTTSRDELLVYLDKRNDHWEQAASTKGMEWHPWHWSQYNAWCLNQGEHCTPKRGSVNWNAELIWKMRSELGIQWELLQEEIPTVFETLLQSLSTCLNNLKSQLRGKGFPSALIDGIDYRLQDLTYRFGLVQQEFTREIKLIHRFASEPNSSSYIVSEMLPAYRSAAGESGHTADNNTRKGTGKAARQRATVQGRITNGTLFPQMSAKIQASIEQLTQKAFIDLQNAATEVLAQITSDVEMALASNPQHANGAVKKEKPEEVKRKKDLRDKVAGLKVKHEQLLAAIATL